MILDDLKNLDPRNPGQWPLPVKLLSFLGIFVVVMAVAYFVLYSDQLAEKDRHKIFEGNARRVYPRLDALLKKRGK